MAAEEGGGCETLPDGRYPASGRHGLAVAAVVAGLMPGLPASAAGPAANGTYLGLEDSVAFGLVPADAVPPPPDHPGAGFFVGYPEDVGQALRLGVQNASCPGETTGSMLVAGAPSNGCENSPDGSPGYRTLYPLHVQYKGTQMQYALSYLAVHRHTRLVTIDIGSNDSFLCLETTSDGCAAEFPDVLKEIGANLTAIYTQIRDVAHCERLGIPSERLMDAAWLGPDRPAREGPRK